jgi:hypothetical protein
MIKYNSLLINEAGSINGYYGVGSLSDARKTACKKVVSSDRMVLVNKVVKDGREVNETTPAIECVRVRSINVEKREADLQLKINLKQLFGLGVDKTDSNPTGVIWGRHIQTFSFPDDVYSAPNVNTCTPGTFAQVQQMWKNQQLVEEYFKTPGTMLIDSKGVTYTTPYFKEGDFRNVGAETAKNLGLTAKGYNASIGSINMTLVTGGFVIMALVEAVNTKTGRGFVAIVPKKGKDGEFQNVFGFLIQGLHAFNAGGGSGSPEATLGFEAPKVVKPAESTPTGGIKFVSDDEFAEDTEDAVF